MAERLERAKTRLTKAKDIGQSGTVMLQAVDAAVTARWPAALERAGVAGDTSTDERVKQVSRAFARELGVVGAATGAAAAVPGVGTGASVALGAGELSVTITRTTDLILTIGAVHGLTNASIEERRAWVLAILSFGESASQGFTKLAGEMGKGLGKKATTKIPMSAIRAVNHALGRTIVTKYGTKRGVIALGRALPFGIGMMIGGGANYAITRAVAKHADKFFSDLPELLRVSTEERGQTTIDVPEASPAPIAQPTPGLAPIQAEHSPTITPRRRLDDRLMSHVLDRDGAFVCVNAAVCQQSAVDKSFGFAGGQLSYVGNHYEQVIEGQPMRVLVVSMQVGDDEAPVTMNGRAAQIRPLIRQTPGQRNPHMRGVTRALQVLYGLPLEPEYERLPNGAHVLDAFAMANSTLCSALPTDGASRRGKPTAVMLDNCATHLAATIETLRPTIIHTQGADTVKVMKGLASAIEEVSETVSRIHVGEHRMILCALAHPAAGPPKSWSSMKPGSYFDTVVRPSLILARELASGY